MGALDGKAAVITGGNSGIGLATAQRFVQEGAYGFHHRASSSRVGQGGIVFVAARGTHKGNPCAYIDLYRVESEKIVEHWGFPEEIPPQEKTKNKNGML